MGERPEPAELLDQLRTNVFLRGLDEATLRALAAEAGWREYAAGEVIFLEGEVSPNLYQIHSGWLKLVKASLEGREQIIHLLGPGETFNLMGIFSPHPNPLTAVALEPVGLWLLRREGLVRLLRERPEFAECVVQNMAERIRGLVSLVEDLSLRPVTGRLARLLLADAVDGVIQRPRWYTQAELAARLGTVPDVVNRALSTLASQGLIAVERQAIRLLDRQALEQLSG